MTNEDDYWICKYCQSTDLVFSREEPMGYYCGSCGKDVVEEEKSDEDNKS